MTRHRARLEVEFDVDVPDGQDLRDSEVVTRIVDAVMEQPNGAVGGQLTRAVSCGPAGHPPRRQRP